MSPFRIKTNLLRVRVEKGISSAGGSACGSLSGHGGNYSRDSGESMPQERGCGAISALAHKLCRSLRMPAAEKPFFSFDGFLDPKAWMFCKRNFVYRLEGTLCPLFPNVEGIVCSIY